MEYGRHILPKAQQNIFLLWRRRSALIRNVKRGKLEIRGNLLPLYLSRDGCVCPPSKMNEFSLCPNIFPSLDSNPESGQWNRNSEPIVIIGEKCFRAYIIDVQIAYLFHWPQFNILSRLQVYSLDPSITTAGVPVFEWVLG